MASEKDAIDVMVRVAEEYKSGLVDKNGLYKRRDALLKTDFADKVIGKLVGSKRRGRVMPKPAAADAKAKTAQKHEHGGNTHMDEKIFDGDDQGLEDKEDEAEESEKNEKEDEENEFAGREMVDGNKDAIEGNKDAIGGWRSRRPP